MSRIDQPTYTEKLLERIVQELEAINRKLDEIGPILQDISTKGSM